MLNNQTLCNRAIDTALGSYGAVQYRDGNTTYAPTYEWNVMLWKNNAWHCDCLGFVHCLVNGFTGDKKKLGGGAVMDEFVLASDEATTLNKYCTNISKDFTKLTKGELLYMDGHVGLYVGEIEPFKDGRIFNVAECTMAFGGGGMLTYVASNGGRFNHKGGARVGTWTAHGKFMCIDYTAKKEEPEITPSTILNICKDVIANKYGNNPQREKTITKKFGAKVYRKVQDIINILYR